MDLAAGVLRVASYNTHRAVGADRRRDPARIVAVINELQPDIIGLQEVEWRSGSDWDASELEYLAHLPGYTAVAGPNISDHRGHYGNLLLTRLPVAEERRIDLSEPGREPRGAIDLDVAIQNVLVRIIATHLGLNLRERWRQARRLREAILDRWGMPTLVLGDLNEWLPGSLTLRPLLTLCEGTGRPSSYPSRWPILSLDRILAHAIPAEIASRTHSSPISRKASDHLPVVASIEIAALPVYP